MRIIDKTGKSTGPYLSVIAAKYADGYRLQVTFNDGKTRIVDFEKFLKDAPQPWITKYRDLKKFKQFKVENGDVNWNDYELIFPITDLYQGEIRYEPADRSLLYPSRRVKSANANGFSVKKVEIPVPTPTLRRLKARAKKEDVPLELLMQRYLEEGMKRESARENRN
ncbi:MAG TPA: DUF2442 domain-containing protein [Candidatus Kapabacteria bacterium]|nr:DUF2442 domain-containing protein [Candidatus Kapabacteria bacterium]